MRDGYKDVLSAFMLIKEPTDTVAVLNLKDQFGVDEIKAVIAKVCLDDDLQLEDVERIEKILIVLVYLLPSYFAEMREYANLLYSRIRKCNQTRADDLLIWAFGPNATNTPPAVTPQQGEISVTTYQQRNFESELEEFWIGICFELHIDKGIGAILNKKREATKVANSHKTKQIRKHLERIPLQKINRKIRNSIMSDLAQQPPLCRLKKIADDETHHPAFYPEEFAEIDLNELKKLEHAVRQKLIGKLRFTPKWKWRGLSQKLTSISNYSESGPCLQP